MLQTCVDASRVFGHFFAFAGTDGISCGRYRDASRRRRSPAAGTGATWGTAGLDGRTCNGSITSRIAPPPEEPREYTPAGCGTVPLRVNDPSAGLTLAVPTTAGLVPTVVSVTVLAKSGAPIFFQTRPVKVTWLPAVKLTADHEIVGLGLADPEDAPKPRL